MQLEVDPEVVITQAGHRHLRLRFAGVTYTAEGCNLDDVKEFVAAGEQVEDCEREHDGLEVVRFLNKESA